VPVELPPSLSNPWFSRPLSSERLEEDRLFAELAELPMHEAVGRKPDLFIRRCPTPRWAGESDGSPFAFMGEGRPREAIDFVDCQRETCGYCGPRRAAIWARAVYLAEPTHLAEVTMPHLERELLAKRVNRLLSEAKVGAAAWYVHQRQEEVGLLVRFAIRNQLPAPKIHTHVWTPFADAALRQGALQAYWFGAVDEPSFSELFLAHLQPVPGPHGLVRIQRGLDEMTWHRELNGRHIVHTTRVPRYWVTRTGVQITARQAFKMAQGRPLRLEKKFPGRSRRRRAGQIKKAQSRRMLHPRGDD
jgi:hypothetical protein